MNHFTFLLRLYLRKYTYAHAYVCAYAYAYAYGITKRRCRHCLDLKQVVVKILIIFFLVAHHLFKYYLIPINQSLVQIFELHLGQKLDLN